MSQPSDFCILVAEDDALIRHVAVNTLTRHGYRVIEARDGNEALWIAAHNEGAPIHLLITNVEMPPGINGHRLAVLLKETRPDMHVLVVSSQSEMEFPPEALNYADVLLKPVDLKSLLNHVRTLLGA